MSSPQPIPASQAKVANPAPADFSFLHLWRGKFVVLEGPDGSGKSTQYRRLAEALEVIGVPHCQVREPGGTITGERIREILLDKAHTGMTVRCEMLLYMASRAELIEQKILPAMQRGEMVLADRFVPSTLAYQGAAGGLSGADIAAVARVATRSLQPDLILLFDIDQASAAKRLSPLLDRMEAKGAEFHRKVRQGYLDQAKADPRRYSVIDASKDADTVWTSVLRTLKERAGGEGR